MTPTPPIPIDQGLRKLFSTVFLIGLARRTGAARRVRQINIVDLFWTLVLGFGLGRARTLAGLRRAYEKTTGQTVEESSFYERFNPGLVAMLKAASVHALDASAGLGRALRGPLACFRDVLLTDSTVVRLHEMLATSFPATRTNHTKAALKTHVVLSVRGDGRQSIRVTSERAHDGPVFRVGPWLKERLLLFDLGYFCYRLFARIDQNGGYFLTRLKRSANPTILRVNRAHRGQAIDVVGAHVHDVVERLERDVLDVMAEVRFARRRYAGHARNDWKELRVVGLRDPQTERYHLYITNIPAEKLTAEDLRITYALRWQMELLFKELKSTYRLGDMPSKKRVVVEALLYATLVTLLVSRHLLAAVRKRWADLAERIPFQRWAAVLEAVAAELLQVMTRPVRETRPVLERITAFLRHEVVDPNRRRPSLLESVETRTHRYQPRNVSNPSRSQGLLR